MHHHLQYLNSRNVHNITVMMVGLLLFLRLTSYSCVYMCIWVWVSNVSNSWTNYVLVKICLLNQKSVVCIQRDVLSLLWNCHCPYATSDILKQRKTFATTELQTSKNNIYVINFDCLSLTWYSVRQVSQKNTIHMHFYFVHQAQTTVAFLWWELGWHSLSCG